MNSGYSEVMTRDGMAGCLDKLRLLQGMSEKACLRRDLSEAVLRACAGAGSGAEQQAARWCQVVQDCQYVRDPVHVEVFRDPLETLQCGGDCDDLVHLLLAGLLSMGIPCLAEGLCDEDLQAFHVRGLIGLPPLAPTTWLIADPVVASERRWAMADVPATSLPAGQETLLAAQRAGLSAPLSSTPSSSLPLLASWAGVAGLLGWWLWWRKTPRVQ